MMLWARMRSFFLLFNNRKQNYTTIRRRDGEKENVFGECRHSSGIFFQYDHNFSRSTHIASDWNEKFLLIYLASKFHSLVTDEIFPPPTPSTNRYVPSTKHIFDELLLYRRKLAWIVKIYWRVGREKMVM